jgi:pyrroloquinoline quinone biosynthesis protein D
MMAERTHMPRRRLLIGEDSRPVLKRFVRLRHDGVRSRWVLLAPERVVEMDDIAVDVLNRCDGSRTLAQIADALATDYDAPCTRILADIIGLLGDLADKGYIKDNPVDAE